MATTINLLSDGNALRRFSSLDGASISLAAVQYDWAVTNASLSISSTDFVVDSRYTLAIATGSEGEAQDVVLTLADIPLTLDDNSRVLSANMRIKANAPITVSALLSIDSPAISNASYSSLYGTTNYSTITPHGFSNGDTVQVTGMTPSSFNRTATVYVGSATQFYFTLFNGSTGGPYISGGIAQSSTSTIYTPYSKAYLSGSYNAVHTNRAVVPDDEAIHTATIQITISGLVGGQTAHLTMPHLIHDLALFENSFLGKARNFLPDFYFEIDSLQSQPSYPFFRLLDMLTSAAGDVFAEYGLMYGVESSQLLYQNLTAAYWAQSSLVSPRSVKNKNVPWLSQFTGESIHQNIYSSDGTPFFENESIRRDFIEWQLSKSYYGRAAGSRIAMTEAAKQVLPYTKDGSQSTFSVALTPRYQDEPFAIHIRTLTNETSDADADEMSELVMQSVNLAKPMGYLISHETVDQFNFSFDDPALGVFDSMTFG